MDKKFKYHFDKRVKRFTLLWLSVIAAIFAAIFLFIGDGYLQAWLISVFIALILLFVLSIPRYVKVTREALEIHCVVELTRIPIEDISSIRKVARKDIGRMWLLLGSYGFFGYYGYYLYVRRWENVKIYAGEWSHFVEIEDIYEQKYYISCRTADSLIETVMQAKLIHAGEETDEPKE